MTSQTTDRRGFLRSSAALAGGAIALPAWLRTAVNGVAEQDPDTAAKLARERQDALRSVGNTAAGLRRPLLVVVVPTAESELYLHARWVGATLNHASDELLLDLARCELVCATVADLAAVFTERRGEFASEAQFVALDLTKRASGKLSVTSVRRLAVDLSGLEDAETDLGPAEESYADWQKRRKESSAARIERYSNAMRGALRGSRLEVQAVREREALGEDLRAAVDGHIAGRRDLHPSVGKRAAAMLHVASLGVDDETERARLLAPVLAGVRAAWVRSPVPGSRWANSMGCGVTIEGVRDGGPRIACGMGRIAPLTERFLFLHAR